MGEVCVRTGYREGSRAENNGEAFDCRLVLVPLLWKLRAGAMLLAGLLPRPPARPNNSGRTVSRRSVLRA